MVLEFKESPARVPETSISALSSDTLIIEYEHLVDEVIRNNAARIFHPDSILDYDDHYSAGLMGLMEAARRYDPSRGKFPLYAVFLIRGRIFDQVRSASERGKVVNTHFGILNEATDELAKILGRSPTVDELQTATGRSLEQIADWYNRRNRSLDQPLTDESDLTLLDTMPAVTGTPSVKHSPEEFWKMVMKPLPRELREVVRLHLFEELRFEAIGERFDISKYSVYRLFAKAKEAIKIRLAELEFGIEDFDLSGARDRFADLSRTEEFEDFYAEVIADRQVPVAIGRFIFEHPKGCTVNEAANGIGYKSTTLRSIVNSGCVETVEDPDYKTHRLIRQPDLVKLAINLYGWVPIAQVAKKIGGNFYSFSRYAKERRFGECALNLSGIWCLRAEVLTRLGEVKDEYSALLGNAKRYVRDSTKFLRKGEMTIDQVVEITGNVCHDTVLNWIIKKGLKARRSVRGSYAIALKDLLSFIRNVMDGQVRILASSKEQLELLYQKLKAD